MAADRYTLTAVLVVCISAVTGLADDARAQAEIRDFTFVGPESRRYAARLRIPPIPNGTSVLLIGGGSVTDLSWTIPGSYEQDGAVHHLTISGEDTRDADTIAAALADAGLIVMQWSSIHEDDELAKQGNGVAMGIKYEKSVPLAARALAVIREQPEVDHDRVIIIGHSLGATRACQIWSDDEGIIGMAFLAGAYTAKTKLRPSELSARALEPTDTDADGVVSPEELQSDTREQFDRIDRDRDRTLQGWELAANAMLERMDAGEQVLDESTEFRGFAWPADVLAAHPDVPVLAIYGGLDSTSVNGPLLERWARAHELHDLIVEYRPDLGHQLSPVQGDLFGPIDPAVVGRIVEWARSLD